MVKKGKKKKQQAASESTSGDASSEKSQQQVSQQQKQEKQEISSQALPDPAQQKPQKVSEDTSQQQVIPSQQQKKQKVPRKQGPQSQQHQVACTSQQQPELPQQQQQQQAWGPPLPQQQVPLQQQAWGPPLPQQQVPPQQQPWGPPLPQPITPRQSAWCHPHLPQQQVLQQQQPTAQGLRQQVPQGLQQQVPQDLRQQVSQGQWQQVPQGLRQQVPQDLRQQVPQDLRQQVPQGLQQQVPQGLRQQVSQGQRQQVPQGQPQQKVAWNLQQQIPQQQQISQAQSQPAWGPPQPQSQLQPAWGPPQSQTQSQPAWGPSQSQQQKPQSQFQQQQQQKTSSSLQQQGAQRQQQQKVSIDTGGSGDHRQVQAKSSMHRQQPSTSAQSPDITQLSSIDPFHKTDKTDLPKMTPAQKKAYFEQIPKRINPMRAGTVGQKITVWTNMFQIIFDDKFVTNAVHYDVTVKPFKDSRNGKEDSQIIKLPKALCRNIFEQCRSTYFKDRFPAYDGNKSAFSANDLPINDMAAVFSHTNNRGEQKQYQIILKKVSNVDLSWIKNLKPGLAQNREQSAIQVLDIIMRHAPESRFTNIGRSLFWDVPTNENTRETLSNGLTLAHGGYLSGVLGWKPYLNVDVSHKAFTVQKRILEYIAQVARVPERSLTYDNVMRNKRKLDGFLKGLKVIYQIPDRSNTKRTHRVYEISSEVPSSNTFDVREPNGTERTYTMKEYFQVVKGYKIMYPNLPTLRVVANANKTLLPMELCTIVPDQPIRKLNEEQTASMIKQAATDAPTRKKRIEDAFKQINVNNSPVMKQEFRLSVSAQMKQVDARILPPPELKYAARTANVSKGVWRLQPFKEAKHLEDKSWTILNLSGMSRMENSLHEFVTMLQQTGREVGMNIKAPDRPFKNFYANEEREIINFFNENKHLKLIIVIIPDMTDVTYGKVKKITEMEIGVLTQCMKFRTLTRANAATVKNILLKINSKLNGVNHVLQTMPACINKSMLVGADVTHPSPDSKDSPSVAAVAASRDDLAFQYNVALRLQPPKQEMILDLENIIIMQLRIYKNRTGYTPQRLIYYRDGVSEGQLPQVMYYEIEAIRKACFKESPQRKIQITCVVVQKRHHIRLFPTDENSDDKNRNVKAGTIVDTDITHPDHIDFYLVSHASIQGTARPTKYRCLCNESNFNEDQLEQLTYHLCHMYARCTRSVSYPAPTYYAHLAAYRGRALLQGNRDFKLCNLQREQEKFQMKMPESPMFFV